MTIAFKLTDTSGTKIPCSMVAHGQSFGIYDIATDCCIAHGYALNHQGTIKVEIVATAPAFHIEHVEQEFETILRNAVGT